MLSENEKNEKLKSVDEWQLGELKGNESICKNFTFTDYLKGIEFVTQIAAHSERLGHHPDLYVGYGKVSVHITTHDAGGLTAKDFELARAIDNIG